MRCFFGGKEEGSNQISGLKRLRMRGQAYSLNWCLPWLQRFPYDRNDWNVCLRLKRKKTHVGEKRNEAEKQGKEAHFLTNSQNEELFLAPNYPIRPDNAPLLTLEERQNFDNQESASAKLV